jgi:hypothetical protein
VTLSDPVPNAFTKEPRMLRESRAVNVYPTLFHRHPDNPILTAADWPYPAHTVFQRGSVPDGR